MVHISTLMESVPYQLSQVILLSHMTLHLNHRLLLVTYQMLLRMRPWTARWVIERLMEPSEKNLLDIDISYAVAKQPRESASNFN